MAVKQNKYLTLELDNQNYAIPILKVKEIIGMMEITEIPKGPDFIKGVINLRGKIIPVIDMRIKFGLEEKAYDERTSIIVTEIKSKNGIWVSGMIVDIVHEVLDINAADIEPTPKYGVRVDQEFLMGVGKVKDKVIMLLDTDKILSIDETEALETAL